jgi:type IV secretory pathway VirD2 relaxase
MAGTLPATARRGRRRETGGFDDKIDALDMTAILDGWQRSGDERMWKLIVSPEFGERVDLQKLTRVLMAQIGRDLGSASEWAGVSHHNTEHPHVHIALRGVDATGRPLRLERDYVKNSVRAIAEDLCTRQLGYRTDRDATESAAREVGGQRFTSLDRDISRAKDGANTSIDTFKCCLPRSLQTPGEFGSGIWPNAFWS